MNHLKMWTITFGLLITAVAISLDAQTTTGTIAGTVVDSAGSILVSARVVLSPSDRQVAADNQGGFRIPNVPVGQYTLTASYVGFASYTATVKVEPGQTANVAAALQPASAADSVMVTAPRLGGEAEAINIERMSADIVQVLPVNVITSLPNTNIADAVGRLPSVSLERDEGEGKYIQIRGTEPRLNNVTINGVNVPAPEVTVRNIKLDAVPADIVERIEVYKTLSADRDADGIGGNVNLVTKTALDKPSYGLSGATGYNPIQNGFWRGGFDGTYGQRFGATKRFGFLLGGTWDRTNRGIDDLEPGQAIGTLPDGTNLAYVNGEDLRSYNYYRTRYGFETGIDYKVTPTMTAYLKGLYADFHDFGETIVYTPTGGTLKSASGSQLIFYSPSECDAINAAAQPLPPNTSPPCSYSNWAYRHYIRRPDQQVFSFLTGATHELGSTTVLYEFAVSRGHNIGGQDFPTTYFSGGPNPNGANDLSRVAFTEDLSNPRRPKFVATDGTNGFDSTSYTVNEHDLGRYHATQLNFQGDTSVAHNYTVYAHPSTFSIGLKIRNSASTQNENDTHYASTGSNPFTLASVVGKYTNPTYYNKSFAINGLAYGPTSSYAQIQRAVAANIADFTEDVVGDATTTAQAFFNSNERIYAGYVQDVIFFGNFRLQGGIRFEGTDTHFLANNVTFDANGNPIITPIRQTTGYTKVLPSVQAQWQFQKDSNLRLVYGRGLSRPNIGDLVPAITIDPNQTPHPTIATGNPALLPTAANNYDVLVEHYFQPLGIVQAGYFYKQLSDPIYPTASLVPFNGTTYQQTLSINGPSGHIQGFEAEYEQRLSFLPGVLNGFGVNVNYSYTSSQVTFPANFDGGRTDHPRFQRMAPNNYNFNLTYDKARFSSRFAISHNDASIAAYQWDASTGPINDPILGLPGPTGDQYFYPHTQFDVQGNYRVYRGLQFVASGLNLSNEVFGFYNGSKIYPVQREYYRPTYSFGFRWALTSEH